MGAEGRKAVDTDGFGGSFGPSLDEARQAYANARDVGKTLRERTGVNAEVSRGVRALAPAKRGSLFAAIERAIEFVGGKARNLRLVGDQSLGDGVIAEMRRRGDDGTMYLDLASIEAKTNDEVEQIAFHEMAHAAEWRFTTPGQWELEEGRRAAWLEGQAPYLLQGATSKELLEALRDAGVSARYDPVKGKIVFGKRDVLKARDISYYALDGADPGTQDSELIAEALRFVCVNGQGMNAVADAIARRFADGS